MNKEMLKKIYIRINNKAEKLFALSYLADLAGVRIHPTVLRDTLKGNHVRNYPLVKLFDSPEHGLCVSASCKTEGTCVEFEHIDRIPSMIVNSVKIRLNGTHEAEYKKGDMTITVGCQTFEVAKLRQLLSEINKVNRKKD